MNQLERDQAAFEYLEKRYGLLIRFVQNFSNYAHDAGYMVAEIVFETAVDNIVIRTIAGEVRIRSVLPPEMPDVWWAE